MYTTFIPDIKLIMKTEQTKKENTDQHTRPRLYCASQVSRESGFSITTTLKDIKNGTLKTIKRGDTYYATPKSLKEYLTEIAN